MLCVFALALPVRCPCLFLRVCGTGRDDDVMASVEEDYGVSVPLPNKQVVHLYKQDIRENGEQVVGFLARERPPLKFWSRIACEFFQLGSFEMGNKVLDEAMKSAAGDRKGKASLLLARGAYFAEQYRASLATGGASLSSQNARDDENYRNADSCFREVSDLLKSELIAKEAEVEVFYVAKGFLALYSDDVRSANYHFNEAMDVTDNASMAGNIGSAVIKFRQTNYAAAARHFSKVLELYSATCGVSVRVSLGHCYYHMDKKEMARKCYERALELDSANAEAMTCLALMNMVDTDSSDITGMQKHIKRLFRAHTHDPKNALALTSLASHYFHGKKFTKVIELCSLAVDSTQNNGIRAESYLLIARTYHKENKLDQASKYYDLAHEAFKQSKTNMAPALFMGLGQMALHKNDLDRAVGHFEKGLEIAPESKDLLLILGTIYANNKGLKKMTEATRYLQRATEVDNLDYRARIELANLYRDRQVDSTMKEALKLYKRSIKAMIEGYKLDPPAPLINNVALLHQQLGDMESAGVEYARALQIRRVEHGKKGGEDLSLPEGEMATLDQVLTGDYLFEKENITLTYNVALFLETTGRCPAAERLHKGIVAAFPAYADSYLRLGAMCRHSKFYPEAEAHYVSAQQHGNADQRNSAVCMLANLKLELGERDAAKRLFSEMSASDVYAKLALANMEVEAAVNSEDPKEKEGHLKTAMRNYQRILLQDGTNTYAANGIGTVLFERGHYRYARDIFTKVNDAAPTFPDPALNLAHVQMKLGKYGTAVQLYESCLLNFGYGERGINLSYLAQALHAAGNKDKCQKTLQRAVRVFPYELSLWLELSNVLHEIGQEEYGSLPLEDAVDDRLVALRSIKSRLANSLRIFKWLAPNLEQDESVEGDDAARYISECAALLEAVQKDAEAATEKKRLVDSYSAEKQAIEDKAREEQEEQERLAREAKEKEAARILEEYQKTQKDMMEVHKKHVEENKSRKGTRLSVAGSGAKKRKKPAGEKKQKKKKGAGENDSSSSSSSSSSDSDSDSDDDNQHSSKKKKINVPSSDSDGIDNLFNSDDSDDDEVARHNQALLAAKEAKNSEEPSGSPEYNPSAPTYAPSAPAPPTTSRMVIDDDDDED